MGGASLLGAGIAVSNWSVLSKAESYRPLLRAGEVFNMHAQRIALHNRPLAPEFSPNEISSSFPQSGGFGAPYIDPDPNYDDMVANNFRDWRLSVEGMVDRPMSLSIDQIHALPHQRTQITMHSCDEGWSAIGQWSGVPLRWLLEAAGLQEKARYIVFYCMDRIGGQNVYGSIDILDAFHPQTILAHSFNGEPLPPKHGAPLRLRIELQIGYKHLKHIDRIIAVENLDDFGQGAGGIFEDYGFQWYACL